MSKPTSGATAIRTILWRDAETGDAAIDEGLMLEELDGAEAGDCKATISVMISCEKAQSWARRTEDVGCVGIGIFAGGADDEVGVSDGRRGMASMLFLENNAGS